MPVQQVLAVTDADGRPVLGQGYDPKSHQFALPQLGSALNDPSTNIPSAPMVAQSPMPFIVQKAGAVSTGSVASLAAVFGSANIAGNTIVVVCAAGSNGTLTVTDTAGNTYISAITGANSTTFETQIFYSVGPVSGGGIAANASNTVTVATTASSSLGVEIYEVNGLLTQVQGVLDAVAAGSGGPGTTASTTTNIVPSSPNELIFAAVAVGTTAEAITAVTGTNWTVDASLNPTTPSGLFSFGSLSLAIGSVQYVTPQATLAGSKAWAICAASFRPIAVNISGVVNDASPYPVGAVPVTGDSGNVGAGTAAATLTAVAGKTTYIVGFTVTGSGATTALPVTVTVTGVISGTMHFTYCAIAGVLVANQPLNVIFPYPIPASAPNTNIVVSCPTLGSGNTNNTVNAFGFNQ